MEPIKISPYMLILFWTVAGLLLGLIPLILGVVKKRAKLGAAGLICSTMGGAILGIFLIVPVIAVFIYLILKKSPTSEFIEVREAGDPIDVKIDNPENR